MFKFYLGTDKAYVFWHLYNQNLPTVPSNPDPPINLREKVSARTISMLGISWDQAPIKSGLKILDYSVFKDDVSVATGLQQTSLVLTGLQYGVTYTFKVKSRNSFGASEDSSPLELLCAIEPEKV